MVRGDLVRCRDEEHDEVGANEMDGARRLAAAKEIEEPGPDGCHCGRHCEAGQNQRREKYQENYDIGCLLQNARAY